MRTEYLYLALDTLLSINNHSHGDPVVIARLSLEWKRLDMLNLLNRGRALVRYSMASWPSQNRLALSIMCKHRETRKQIN